MLQGEGLISSAEATVTKTEACSPLPLDARSRHGGSLGAPPKASLPADQVHCGRPRRESPNDVPVALTRRPRRGLQVLKHIMERGRPSKGRAEARLPGPRGLVDTDLLGAPKGALYRPPLRELGPGARGHGQGSRFVGEIQDETGLRPPPPTSFNGDLLLKQ